LELPIPNLDIGEESRIFCSLPEKAGCAGLSAGAVPNGKSLLVGRNARDGRAQTIAGAITGPYGVFTHILFDCFGWAGEEFIL
jgi:hypothetical protein